MMKAKKLIVSTFLAILLLSTFACTRWGAEFVVYNLSISPSPAEVGEEVTISVAVENVGQAEGTKDIVLKVDGEKMGSSKVTVAPGAAITITFDYTAVEEGSYTIKVDGEEDTLIVTERH